MSGIRRETAADYRAVEELHRNAFWNVHVPGCCEHYLAHVLRKHPDFIPELDLVYELDGEIVGNVMYTKSELLEEGGNSTGILTFGPIGVAPEYQRRGIGKALLEASFDIAAGLGYPAIAIFGDPDNYVDRGFRSCKRYNVCLEGDVYPAALLVKELKPGFFDGRKLVFRESPAYEIQERDAEAFDAGFPPKEKAFRPSQETFFILSHSTIG